MSYGKATIYTVTWSDQVMERNRAFFTNRKKAQRHFKMLKREAQEGEDISYIMFGKHELENRTLNGWCGFLNGLVLSGHGDVLELRPASLVEYEQ
ncbi:MAG: hypothetical protein CME70_17770 [Halobacteriovorax sp.]|nr:hypothetical protein [Halobacteriovorax sp.]|tara:strand:+ start:18901 stop:19185 length:285 start_codon:yes stop_codon:yes gene_type:complete